MAYIHVGVGGLIVYLFVDIRGRARLFSPPLLKVKSGGLTEG
jgi:hypothetical protein